MAQGPVWKRTAGTSQNCVLLKCVDPKEERGPSFSGLAMPRAKLTASRTLLPKAPTGIEGLDEVTGGGLPKGRTTLLCGSAGCGKTLLAMEFLVHGALQYGEPGVCMEFEESTDKLPQMSDPWVWIWMSW
jgi:predicted ATP-dependent serine protease